MWVARAGSRCGVWGRVVKAVSRYCDGLMGISESVSVGVDRVEYGSGRRIMLVGRFGFSRRVMACENPGLWGRAWLGALVLLMRENKDLRWMLFTREPLSFVLALDAVKERAKEGCLLWRSIHWWRKTGRPDNVMMGLEVATQRDLNIHSRFLFALGAKEYCLEIDSPKEGLDLRCGGKLDLLADGRVSVVLVSGECSDKAYHSMRLYCAASGVLIGRFVR